MKTKIVARKILLVIMEKETVTRILSVKGALCVDTTTVLQYLDLVTTAALVSEIALSFK